MSMVVAWLLFPIVLLAVCGGCGLLVERIGGFRLPGTLVPSVGFATVVVLGTGLTYKSATAGLATPSVVVAALAGYGAGWRRLRESSPDRWAIAVGVGLFAVYAAPVVFTGQATFLGYFFLNDTSVHFGLVDQLASHGRDIAAAPPSAIRSIVGGYLGTGYPVGAHAGLAAVRPLVGQDVAWVYQPYLAVMLSLAGVALYAVLARVVESRPLRALAAFIAGQAGLVYAYYMQSSIKELAGLWALTVIVPLAFATLAPGRGVRRVIPIAVVAAAGLEVLSATIAPWLAPALLVVVVGVLWQLRLASRRERALTLSAFAALVAVAAFPIYDRLGTFVDTANSVLIQSGDVGNLIRPLEWWQVLGIWPRGDFRFPLEAHQPTAYALMGIAVAALVLGALWLVRRAALAPLLLLGTSLVVAYVLTRHGSPYAVAKVMMIASPAIVLTAMLGGVALRTSGLAIEGWLVALAVAGGVLWTTALAYHDADPAPRNRLEELVRIDHRFAGKGPAFENETDEFVPHFLRDVHAFNAPFAPPSFASAAAVPTAGRGRYPYDINQVAPSYLQQYRLLVLRRSPIASRPPANFRRVYSTPSYDVWERGPAPTVLEHLPIARATTEAGGLASCAAVRSVAARAAALGARLAYVERARTPSLIPTRAQRPPDWGEVSGDPDALIQRGKPGDVRGSVVVTAPGQYRVWLEGTFDRALPIYVGGRRVGRAGPRELGPPGSFVRVGEIGLPAGPVRIRIVRRGNNLEPADGGTNRFVGPLVLDPVADARRLRYLAPRDAGTLCGRRLDWLEIVR
jgi:hypothetical protein